MRNLLLSILLLTAVTRTYATTHISTALVSGHWTLSGSPYIIHNNIAIPTTASLTIDPGVEVAFDGYYRFTVNGILNASGTASAPIVFKAFDTTGWSGSAPVGGWIGLSISGYFLTSTITLDYCRFQDMRAEGVYSNLRKLAIRNCEFVHNQERVLVAVFADTLQTFDLYNCDFHDNTASTQAVWMLRGNCHMHKCRVRNNVTGVHTAICDRGKALLDSNEFCNNLQLAVSLATTLYFSETNGTIRGNKIHHNVSQYDGALSVATGHVDIVGNLICNNRTAGAGTCGALEGGGGIRIGGDSNSYYTVRNNVIANNYAAFAGGAMYLMHASVEISNNTIINNRGVSGGAIYVHNPYISGTCPHTRVDVKNNIFKNNVTQNWPSFSSDTLSPMFLMFCDTISYENNISEHHFANSFLPSIPAAFLGDTGSNQNRSNPGLVAPTLAANYLENALSANFNLLATSPARDSGDITGITLSPVDFLGHPRIVGSAIDIGAFEFIPSCPDTITGPHTMCVGSPILFTHPVGGGAWSCYDPEVTVGASTGSVTGITYGTATVNYITGSCISTATVHVDSLPEAGVLTGLTSLCAGSSVPLSAGAPGGIWTSSTSAASVLGGIVSGISGGTSTISYILTNACGSDTATLPVTVTPLPDAGTLTGPTAVCTGSTITLSSSTAGGSWSSSSAYAPVTGGIVNGLAAGPATIMYMMSNACGSDTATLPVIVDDVLHAGVLTGPTSVCQGSTIALSASTTGGIWLSTVAYASVYGGIVTGIAPGVETITYYVSNACGSDMVTLPVTVNALPAAITGPGTKCIGESTVLSSGTGGGTWSSSNMAIANINASTGLITAMSAGTTTITYTLAGGCYTTSTFTVNACHISTGINEVGGGNAFRVYPNPVSSELTIETSETITQLSVCDPQGQLVYEAKPNSKQVQIDMRNYSRGIYFVRINGTTTKVIKE